MNSNGTSITVLFPPMQRAFSGPLPGLKAGTITVKVYNQHTNTGSPQWTLIGSTTLTVSDTRPPPGVVPSLPIPSTSVPAVELHNHRRRLCQSGLWSAVANFYAGTTFLAQARATSMNSNGTSIIVPYPTNDTEYLRTPAWTEGGKHHREGVQPARKHRIFSVDADRQHDTGRQRYATSAWSEFHKPKSHRPGVPAVDLGTTYRRRFRQSGLRAIRSQLLRGDDLPRPGTRDVDEFERHLDHSSVSDQRHQYLRTPAWTEGGNITVRVFNQHANIGSSQWTLIGSTTLTASDSRLLAKREK